MEVKPGSCVYILDDVISDELCETIKIIIDNTLGYMEEYATYSNVQSKTVRIEQIENKKFAGIIDKEIFKVVSDIIKRVSVINPDLSEIYGDSGYQLRKIHGETREHVDGVFPGLIPNIKENPKLNMRDIRKASLIIALNDDYEGGEFYFKYQDIKVRLKKGQCIVFPPYWTHPHMVNKPENGTVRYTINTWLSE